MTPVGRAVAERLCTGLDRDASIETIELGELTSAIHTWFEPTVVAAKETVLAADVLVVVSPVYKASFSGLLKSLFDHFVHDQLAAVPTVPVMVGASDGHQLAVEQQLKPVLVEIGASRPTRGIYVVESELAALKATIEA